MADEFDYNFKVLIVGNANVGKSCLQLRVTSNEFSEVQVETLPGEDIKAKVWNIGGKRIRTAIWDTAGQEKFRGITSSFYRNANGAILVYDITDGNSFTDLVGWFADTDRYTTGGEEESAQTEAVPRIVVGNKCDLIQQRVVHRETAEELAQSHKTLLFETSAKENTNVDEAFHVLIKLMIKQAGDDLSMSDAVKKSSAQPAPNAPAATSSASASAVPPADTRAPQSAEKLPPPDGAKSSNDSSKKSCCVFL